MSLNHHILAKAVTDEILGKFKRMEWQCAGCCGRDFYRVGTNADFPSPDAVFYDPTEKMTVSFEFKPPTETKRGILTGVGQSIAYLQTSNVSFLVAPAMLGGYPMGTYLSDLYLAQVYGKIPAGLILYDDSDLSQVTLAHDAVMAEAGRKKYGTPKSERFWAKHQDLPIPLFHLILHYYYLASTHMIEDDPFAACWRERMTSKTVLDDFVPAPILDVNGKIIETVAGRKPMRFLEKIIGRLKDASPAEKRDALKQEIDTEFVGDNYYTSVKKNLVSFLKNLRMIDSENRLTEQGFKLYHLGLVNGPTSKTFIDYFVKELLTVGHHVDLILDFSALRQKAPGEDVEETIEKMEAEYESKGYIKRNPNRQRASMRSVKFLKYERIAWKALGLVDAGHVVQWKAVVEACSLPDL